MFKSMLPRYKLELILVSRTFETKFLVKKTSTIINRTMKIMIPIRWCYSCDAGVTHINAHILNRCKIPTENLWRYGQSVV